jgi:hypothetical protein
VFGRALANPVAEKIWTLLGEHPDGLTRTEINRALGHVQSRLINDALRELESPGRIERAQISSAGRSTERVKRAEKADYAEKAPRNGEVATHNPHNPHNPQPRDLLTQERAVPVPNAAGYADDGVDTEEFDQ